MRRRRRKNRKIGRGTPITAAGGYLLPSGRARLLSDGRRGPVPLPQDLSDPLP